MRIPAAAASISVPPETLQEITALYERAKPLGSLLNWKGTEARVMAGRLATNLGDIQLGCFLHLRAWADDRASALAAVFCGYTVCSRKGPLAAWRFLRRLPAFPEATNQAQVDLLALQARVQASFRDFAAAEESLTRASEKGAHEAWLWCERASIRELEDRYEEALEAAQHALALQPWFRPAVQQAAQTLQHLNRDAEAVRLLEDALLHCESPACAGQLSAVHEELGAFDDAIRACERMREWSPLFDERAVQGWHARMAELLYLAGRREAAAEHAAQAGNEPASTKFVERLASDAPSRRVILPVGFVRQHHFTCAPATLSAIAGFLGQPVDHLALAREITYDGTPDHVERSWAQRNGFAVREFRVTWDAAVALLERGLPFDSWAAES